MQTGNPHLPGTPRHQLLLQTIVDFYAGDPRILAVTVFGSLGRGNWDAYSDLDLDIIITDGLELDGSRELERLCRHLERIGETAALIIPDAGDSADVVFESLMQLSARFHPLAATNPAIIETVRVVAGRIDREAIVAAGRANQQEAGQPLPRLLDQCVRYVAAAGVAVQRGRTWITVELLHRMRGLLMAVYTQTHGGGRAFYVFEDADVGLQARFGKTLPQQAPASLRGALLQVIDILENDLDGLSAGALRLADGHRRVLAGVRRNLED